MGNYLIVQMGDESLTLQIVLEMIEATTRSSPIPIHTLWGDKRNTKVVANNGNNKKPNYIMSTKETKVWEKRYSGVIYVKIYTSAEAFEHKKQTGHNSFRMCDIIKKGGKHGEDDIWG